MANPSFNTVSEPFILSYPTILTPEPYKDKNTGVKGEPQYNFEAISEIDSLGQWKIKDREKGEYVPGNVELRMVELAKEAWGEDFNAKVANQHNDPAWPFKSGDKKFEEKGDKAALYQGKKFWRAKGLTKKSDGTAIEPPVLYDYSSGTLVKLMRSSEEDRQRISEIFYAGAICTAEVNWVANNYGTSKNLTAYVKAVIFHRDGERIGGGSNVEKLYGVQGGETTYDPTAGMSNEIPDF